VTKFFLPKSFAAEQQIRFLRLRCLSRGARRMSPPLRWSAKYFSTSRPTGRRDRGGPELEAEIEGGLGEGEPEVEVEMEVKAGRKWK
jgi:hypothetical protein